MDDNLATGQLFSFFSTPTSGCCANYRFYPITRTYLAWEFDGPDSEYRSCDRLYKLNKGFLIYGSSLPVFIQPKTWSEWQSIDQQRQTALGSLVFQSPSPEQPCLRMCRSTSSTLSQSSQFYGMCPVFFFTPNTCSNLSIVQAF